MTFIEKAVAMIKGFEACRLEAYPDPAAADGHPWTIGYGATGPDIKPGVTWTQDKADADLRARVTDLCAQIHGLVTEVLPDQSFAALVSFAYNVGLQAFKESTLLRQVNAGHVLSAADEFLKWTHAGGRVYPGLVTRRQKERAAFLAGLDASSSVV